MCLALQQDFSLSDGVTTALHGLLLIILKCQDFILEFLVDRWTFLSHYWSRPLNTSNFCYYYNYGDCARISSLSHNHVRATFRYKDNVCASVIFCTEDLTQRGLKYQYNGNGLINTRQLMNPFKQGCRKEKKKSCLLDGNFALTLLCIVSSCSL